MSGDVVPGVAQGTDLQALGRAVITKPFELMDLEGYVTQWTPGARRVDTRSDIRHTESTDLNSAV